MKKGQIAVETADIFPIIKKWLYSDHDVFLRELVSNGMDAIAKRQVLDSQVEKPSVRVEIHADQKQIKIIDNGIGMTAEELEKYIAQIAFSGATDFIKNIQKENNDKEPLIGQFGLGFYASFMVADKVEIFSQSFQDDTKGVHWICEGESDYEFEEKEGLETGTTIVLHLNADSQEFLEEARVNEVLRRYCSFMKFPLQFKDETINTQAAIWIKRPSELEDKDYKDLYQFLYPFEEEPIFWIHFNLDYPFELQGILYFPKIKQLTARDLDQNSIQLFCKQVFVSNQVADVVPNFLTLLKGIIDSPEIPLNVSRSALQGDPKIKLISDHILKKVVDALKGRLKNEKEQFIKDWPNLAPFIKIGFIQNDKFAERAKDLLLFETTEGKTQTLAEYTEAYAEPLKKLGEDKKHIIYIQAGQKNQALMDALKSENLAALVMDQEIDSHFVHAIETRETEYQFHRVDSVLEKLLGEESPSEIITGTDEKKPSERIQGFFKECLHKTDEELEIETIPLKDDKIPAILKLEEQPRRIKEMMDLRGMGGMGMPMKEKLIVNANHPLMKNILHVADSPARESILPLLCQQVYQLAKWSSTDVASMTSQEKDQFLGQSVELLQELTRRI